MGLGYNLFLDMITRNSAVRAASSPLAAVVKQAATVFDLLPLLGSQEAVDKLISFALELEKGYPVEGYHCRLHAADVTARLTAILNLTGLGARSARLAALVAAALHDYEHPQVTNHFLIQQVASRPLRPPLSDVLPAVCANDILLHYCCEDGLAVSAFVCSVDVSTPQHLHYPQSYMHVLIHSPFHNHSVAD